MVIPARLVKRWKTQISTSYANLAETEKESDREQVRRYLPVIINVIVELTSGSRFHPGLDVLVGNASG